MKWIVSRYEHKIAYIQDYTNDVVLYDRSNQPISGAIVVPNIGSDLFDKFSFIIDNYGNLPDVALYTKANLFDYIKPKEFEKIKDNTTFTPILTQGHHTYEPICRYTDGMYEEINNYWYLNAHPAKYAKEIIGYFQMEKRAYNTFAPGSNYILPRENIRKTPLDDYKTLRSYLEWAVYPGDAQLLERNLYYLWKS